MEPASLQAGEPEEQREWYVLRGKEQVGPVSFGDLLKFVQQGLLLASHFVWKPGFSTWVRADTVAGLFLPPAPLPKAPVETDLSRNVGIIIESLRADPGQQTGSEHPVQEASSESNSTITLADEKVEVSQRSNYFIRHWRGELSLPVSWWINGSLASVAAAMLVLAIIEQLKGSLAPDAALPTVLGIYGSIYLLAMWQVVGTWRSATAYGRIHPRRWWGAVVKLLLLIALLRIAVDFVQYTAPTINNLYGSYQSARLAKSLAGTTPISQQVAYTGSVADNRAAIFTRAEIRAALNSQTEMDTCKKNQNTSNISSQIVESYCACFISRVAETITGEEFRKLKLAAAVNTPAENLPTDVRSTIAAAGDFCRTQEVPASPNLPSAVPASGNNPSYPLDLTSKCYGHNADGTMRTYRPVNGQC